MLEIKVNHVTSEELVQRSREHAPRTVGEYLEHARGCLGESAYRDFADLLSGMPPESELPQGLAYTLAMASLVGERVAKEPVAVEPLHFDSNTPNFSIDPNLRKY